MNFLTAKKEIFFWKISLNIAIRNILIWEKTKVKINVKPMLGKSTNFNKNTEPCGLYWLKNIFKTWLVFMGTNLNTYKFVQNGDFTVQKKFLCS